METTLEDFAKFYLYLKEYYSKEYNGKTDHYSEHTLVDVIITPFFSTNTGKLLGFEVKKLMNEKIFDYVSSYGSGPSERLYFLQPTTYTYNDYLRCLSYLKESEDEKV